MQAKATIFTSIVPDRLAKKWSIVDGAPIKEAAGEMVSGTAAVHSFESLDGFASILSGLKPNQAITYGVPKIDAGPVVTRKQWQADGRPSNVITRTKDAMTFPDGPGVMMIDYDPPKDKQNTLTHSDLFAMLVEACPSMAGVGYVTIPSASSHIYNGEQEVAGLRGQRLYFMVKNAMAIPEAGERLFKLLFAADHGWVEISKAGSMLKRTIIDRSVWQSNRFDFAAGAVCVAPLSQRRGAPVVVDGRVLDCIKDIPKLCAERAQKHADAVLKVTSESEFEAESVSSAYQDERGRELAGVGATRDEIKNCIAQVKKAVENAILMGDMRVTVFEDDGARDVAVLSILEDPERYHGALTLDPIEHDYDGGRPVGKLYLLGRTPCLRSFAHGGRTFKLSKMPEMILLEQGKTTEAVNGALKKMRDSREIYDRGGMVSMVNGDKITHLKDGGLLYWLGSQCQFYYEKYNEKADKMTTVLKDPPQSVVKMIDHMGQQRQLRPLKRISTHPVMMPSGSIVERPGYHEESEILFQFDEDAFNAPPKEPTIEDAKAAFDTIMHPFRFFPFVDDLDRTALFAAVVSAVMRPVISTCPAFAFDAPVQGSGKTLLAKAVAAIAAGKQVDVTPHVSGRDDEEIRKRIMSILKEGDEAVIWDNIMGVFNSASMAGMLTSKTYSDRLLGVSDKVAFPNSALWLLTGNNLQLSGDMPRRVITCRIDPRTDQPFAREFEFDPEAYCVQRRMEIVSSVLVLLSAWTHAGRPRNKGKLASFEEWDELVRQPIAWLAGNTSANLVDPMDIVKAGQTMDNEQTDWLIMLKALRYQFVGESYKFTVKDLMAIYEKVKDKRYTDAIVSDHETEIHDSIADCLGSRLSGRAVGKMLSFRVDRIVDGLALRRLGKGRHGQVWTVTDASNNELGLADAKVTPKSHEEVTMHENLDDVPF